MSTPAFNRFFALLAFATAAGVVGVALTALLARRSPDGGAARLLADLRRSALWFGWVVALGTTLGGYWLPRMLRDTNTTRPIQTVIALGAVVTLTLAVMSVASKFSTHFDHVHLQHLDRDRGVLAENMTILMIAFLPAMAGALRFISEKMALEAEARSYRDALEWFERADRLLSELRPGQGRQEADARARDVVLQLGILALGESQQWLKSRRERPLSPLIGG